MLLALCCGVVAEGPGRYGKMPDFAGAEQLQRKVVLLTFRAPSEPPDPAWAQLQLGSPNDLRVLEFSSPAESPEVAAFMGRLSQQVGPLEPLPLCLLVNRQGEIIYRRSGPLDDQFRTALRDELSSR